MQAKFKPIWDTGESNLIKKANDFYRTDRRNMKWNHGWLPPSWDASRGRFPSVAMDEEPNKAREAVMPTITY
jgi:hypothetical protein